MFNFNIAYLLFISHNVTMINIIDHKLIGYKTCIKMS